ncbi:hypothetical protein MIN45_P1080 [Methylomarinovum tepidoasis]|uniref:Uroporphyrinogen-III synthase n=1 Tax=Methylomarinovum tepidoasis TaxID=2840183 RepID=A0AAU9CD38_9GAMM|nr:uroporphyrinogen-III synthase [Methylomarinovum sp. IN45]BCX88711.1 hypothetical protein MIN45_P1080 [Methylomarinovum sp. IN45]
MAEPLAGRRVLVTRPEHQAENLCRLLRARGAEPWPCPMLRLAPLPPPSPAWWQGYDWLIFVSANAVRFARDAGLPARIAAKVAAIGRATAAALEKSRLTVACQAPPPYTSESLLTLPVWDEIGGRRVLIVRGRGGRPELGQALARRGAEVACAELYRRLPPAPESVTRLHEGLAAGLDAVLVSSGEVLANLIAAAGARLRELPLVAPSERVAAQARQAGFEDVTVAASALDEVMVAALQRRLTE